MQQQACMTLINTIDNGFELRTIKGFKYCLFVYNFGIGFRYFNGRHFVIGILKKLRTSGKLATDTAIHSNRRDSGGVIYRFGLRFLAFTMANSNTTLASLWVDDGNAPLVYPTSVLAPPVMTQSSIASLQHTSIIYPYFYM